VLLPGPYKVETRDASVVEDAVLAFVAVGVLRRLLAATGLDPLFVRAQPLAGVEAGLLGLFAADVPLGDLAPLADGHHDRAVDGLVGGVLLQLLRDVAVGARLVDLDREGLELVDAELVADAGHALRARPGDRLPPLLVFTARGGRKQHDPDAHDRRHRSGDQSFRASAGRKDATHGKTEPPFVP